MINMGYADDEDVSKEDLLNYIAQQRKKIAQDREDTRTKVDKLSRGIDDYRTAYAAVLSSFTVAFGRIDPKQYVDGLLDYHAKKAEQEGVVNSLDYFKAFIGTDRNTQKLAIDEFMTNAAGFFRVNGKPNETHKPVTYNDMIKPEPNLDGFASKDASYELFPGNFAEGTLAMLMAGFEFATAKDISIAYTEGDFKRIPDAYIKEFLVTTPKGKRYLVRSDFTAINAGSVAATKTVRLSKDSMIHDLVGDVEAESGIDFILNASEEKELIKLVNSGDAIALSARQNRDMERYGHIEISTSNYKNVKDDEKLIEFLFDGNTEKIMEKLYSKGENVFRISLPLRKYLFNKKDKRAILSTLVIHGGDIPGINDNDSPYKENDTVHVCGVDYMAKKRERINEIDAGIEESFERINGMFDKLNKSFTKLEKDIEKAFDDDDSAPNKRSKKSDNSIKKGE